MELHINLLPVLDRMFYYNNFHVLQESGLRAITVDGLG